MNGLSGISPWRLLPVAALMLILSACGGGGGDNSTPPPAPTPTPDTSPDAFTFSPAQVTDAVASGSYTATATITGFDGELAARVTEVTGNASGKLIGADSEATDELEISSGDVLTLRMILGGLNPSGNTASATVTVGEGSNARSATFNLAVVDKQGPQLAVHFPAARSVTQDETLTVTGAWSDNEAVERITSLGDGVEALLLPDNHWQTTVALQPGRNLFAFEAHDASGNRSDTVNLEIFRQAPFFDTPRAVMEVDGDLVVLSAGITEKSIRRIDPETLENIVISDASTGTGPMWISSIGPLAANADNTTYFLVDRGDPGNHKVFSIDVATGNRVVLAEGFTAVRGITAGPDDNVLLVGKSDGVAQMAVIAIDAAGGHEVVSRPGLVDSQIGGGDSWIDPVDLSYDSTRGNLYVLTTGGFTRGVYSVDIETGDREEFSVNSDGKGQTFELPVAIDVDLVNGDLYVVDFRGQGAEAEKRPILKIQTAGANPGARSVVSNNDNPGPALSRPVDIEIVREDEGVHLLIADDEEDDGIIRVQAANGEKTRVPGAITAGEGAVIDNADLLAIDAANNRLLLSDTDNRNIRSVDLTTGNRSDSMFTPFDGVFISDLALEGGTIWAATRGDDTGLGSLPLADLDGGAGRLTMLLDDSTDFSGAFGLLAEPGHVFMGTRVAGGFHRVVDVDVDTGNFTEVSSDADTAEPGFDSTVYDLVRIDETHLLAGTQQGLILIDTAATENERRLLADEVASAFSLAYDPARKLAFALDSINGNLAVINLSDLDAPAVTLLFGEQADREVAAGYGVSPNFISRFRYDETGQRLFVLSDRGDEVTMIDMSDVRFDADEDGDIDENDVIDGVAATRLSGEAVLLSRGDSAFGPSFSSE